MCSTREEGLRGTGGNVVLIPGTRSKVRPAHSSLHFPSFPQEVRSPLGICGSYKQSQAQSHSVPNWEGYPVLRQRTLRKTHRRQTETFGEDEFMCSIPPYCPPHHPDIACSKKMSQPTSGKKTLRAGSKKYLAIVTYVLFLGF